MRHHIYDTSIGWVKIRGKLFRLFNKGVQVDVQSKPEPIDLFVSRYPRNSITHLSPKAVKIRQTNFHSEWTPDPRK